MEEKRLLLVIDMQEDFINGSLKNEEAQKIVPKVAKKICNYNGDGIMFTADTHGENYLETFEGEHLPVEHCILGTPGWEIEKSLIDAANRNTVKHTIEKKFTFGDVYLKEKIFDFLGYDPTEIEICGICSDICVLTNVLLLRTTLPDCRLIVHKDLCAGTTIEAHDATMKVLASCQVEVI